MSYINTDNTLYSALVEIAEQQSDNDALVLGDRRLTYSQFLNQVDAFSTGLTKLGIRKGDKAGLILPACVENVLAFFAFSKIGAPFVPMSPQLRASEVKHILSDSEASAVVTIGELMGHSYVDMIESVRENLSSLVDIYLNYTSFRMNEIMKVLTIIATIFIPLTFLAGLYGMNFKHMPELEFVWAYPLLIVVMVAVALVMVAFFWKRKWLGRS